MECVTNAANFNRNYLSEAALQPAEGSYWDGDDQSGSEDFVDQSDSDSPYFDWDGFSQDRLCHPSFEL